MLFIVSKFLKSRWWMGWGRSITSCKRSSVSCVLDLLLVSFLMKIVVHMHKCCQTLMPSSWHDESSRDIVCIQDVILKSQAVGRPRH